MQMKDKQLDTFLPGPKIPGGQRQYVLLSLLSARQKGVPALGPFGSKKARNGGCSINSSAGMQCDDILAEICVWRKLSEQADCL